MSGVKETKIWHVVVMFAILIGCLIYGLGFAKTGAHVPLFFAAMALGVFAMTVMKYEWDDLQAHMFESIRIVSIALVLLYIIGMVIATWILSGVVPTMIYYGLQVINPKYFLVSAAILCGLISLPTGSSWTTAGTVGVALMGIGEGLGVSMAMTAGAVLSGAYFGDKLSPLSDTSNLAVAVANANLVEHVKHMLWTSIPAFIATLIAFFFLGLGIESSSAQTSVIQTMLSVLGENYNITPWLLMVPVAVIGIIILKVPAILGLFFGALIGGVVALFTQEGVTVPSIIEAMHYGITTETGNELVDSLLSRGGMAGMYDTVALIISVALISGMLDATKATYVLTKAIVAMAHSTGQLVAATVFSSIICNVILSDQYIAIMVTGKMFQQSFKDRGLASKNLSRTLQDSATVTSALVPWNTCGAYMTATLGVAPWVYVPYAFFNLLMPFFSILAAYLNFTMTTIAEEQSKLKANS